MGGLGSLLGASWRLLVASWRFLGKLLAPLGGFLGPLGHSCEDFCCHLGDLWDLLGAIWVPKGPPKAPKSSKNHNKSGPRTRCFSVVSHTAFPMQFKGYLQRVFESCAQAWECAKPIKTYSFCTILTGRRFLARSNAVAKKHTQKAPKSACWGAKIKPKSSKVRLKSYSEFKIGPHGFKSGVWGL